LKGKSCWFAALEVISTPYMDHKNHIWSDDIYPCRIDVKPVVVLNPDTAIDARKMIPTLDLFSKVRNSQAWGFVLISAPKKLSDTDGETLFKELNDLKINNPLLKEPETKFRNHPVQKTTREINPDIYTGERRHDELKRKVMEIGEVIGKYATTEFRTSPYIYDVVWKDMEGLPRPTHVFEVQDKGSIDSALAKLQHARDIWRPKLFLVVTEESDKIKVDSLLKPYLQGTFHGISKDTIILTAQTIDEIYTTFSHYKDTVHSFVEQ
jgi:hypothetical protein